MQTHFIIFPNAKILSLIIRKLICITHKKLCPKLVDILMFNSHMHSCGGGVECAAEIFFLIYELFATNWINSNTKIPNFVKQMFISCINKIWENYHCIKLHNLLSFLITLMVLHGI